MTEEMWVQVLAVAKWVLMSLAFWAAWSLRNVFLAGWNIQKFLGDYERFKADQAREFLEMKVRMDRAGKLCSDLATEVQGLPETLRREFREEYLPRREADLLAGESRVDRERLHSEINSLWSVVNRRK